MLKSNTNFWFKKNTPDLDRWEDEGGFTGCMNSTEKRSASIRAETSPADPHSLRFVLDRDVQGGALATFTDAAAAQGAPLAETLVAIAGVKRVDVSGAVVTVVKTDDSDWEALKRPIADALHGSIAQSSWPLGQGIKIIGQAQTEAEIASDGIAHDHPATCAATAGSVLRDQIRAHLVSLSAADVPMTYGKLARAMGLYAPGSIAKVTQALEATMVEDAENGAPFLASLVVSKVGQGNAAKGFFQQAHALGRGPGFGEDDSAYYQREFTGAGAMLTDRG